MIFRVVVKQKSIEAINELPEKIRRILFNTLENPEKNPWPGSGGDKENLHPEKEIEIYRLQIERTFTAIYMIDTKNYLVRIHDLMTIEQAHKKYGRL